MRGAPASDKIATVCPFLIKSIILSQFLFHCVHEMEMCSFNSKMFKKF